MVVKPKTAWIPNPSRGRTQTQIGCRCGPQGRQNSGEFTNKLTFPRLDFVEFNLAQPFTCGASGSSTVQLSPHQHGTILLFWGRNILLLFISQVCTSTDGPLIGDCLTDTFTVTSPGEFSTRTSLLLLIKKSDRIFSPGSRSPPVICGYNTGQHM